MISELQPEQDIPPPPPPQGAMGENIICTAFKGCGVKTNVVDSKYSQNQDNWCSVYLLLSIRQN